MFLKNFLEINTSDNHVTRACWLSNILDDIEMLTTSANICWSSRSLEDVFKTCLEDVFKTPSAYVFQDVLQRRLEDVLEDEKFLHWRHVLKTPWRHVFKTSSRYIFKTSSIYVFKTSWRQTKCLPGISVSKKSKSVSDKSISHISISDKPRRIQNASFSTQ